MRNKLVKLKLKNPTMRFIHFTGIFHYINHPFGVPSFMETPKSSWFLKFLSGSTSSIAAGTALGATPLDFTDAGLRYFEAAI